MKSSSKNIFVGLEAPKSIGNKRKGKKQGKIFSGAPNGAKRVFKTIDLGLFFAAKRRLFFLEKKQHFPLRVKFPPCFSTFENKGGGKLNDLG